MDSIVRNVGELSSSERHVYESVLGQPLRNDQQVILQLVDGVADSTDVNINGAEVLLAPYTIWGDLDDAEIADLESAVLQRSDSRPTESRDDGIFPAPSDN